jgi:ABC-type multidrug transport system ATPase subunit
MSFGIDYGECFAMLGVNGSGKSTTFKCLTNEFHPTKGSLTINGLNVQRDFSKVRSMIGYCPQYDSIFDWMSVEEHLWFYAKIKGIPTEFRADLIERQITEMNL